MCSKLGFTDYSKTSCLCENCLPLDYNKPKSQRANLCTNDYPPYGFINDELNNIVPTNLSTPNCNQGDEFTCLNKALYKVDIQPGLTRPCSLEGGPWQIKNINALGLRYSTGFIEVCCDDVDNLEGSGCKGKSFTSNDPRLIDSYRGMRLNLDRPPLDGEVAVGNVVHDEIYDDKYKNYGKCYSTYNSINGGQIQYYVDKSISQPYFTPLFTVRSQVENTLFVDPMDNPKPMYPRFPLEEYNWKNFKGEGNSSTYDTIRHREDIMEGQMAKINQKKWEARWGDKVCTYC